MAYVADQSLILVNIFIANGNSIVFRNGHTDYVFHVDGIVDGIPLMTESFDSLLVSNYEK